MDIRQKVFKKLSKKELISCKCCVNKESVSRSIDFYKMVDINADDKTV